MHATYTCVDKLHAVPVTLLKTEIEETTTRRCSRKGLDGETAARPQNQRQVLQGQMESPARSIALTRHSAPAAVSPRHIIAVTSMSIPQIRFSREPIDSNYFGRDAIPGDGERGIKRWRLPSRGRF